MLRLDVLLETTFHVDPDPTNGSSSAARQGIDMSLAMWQFLAWDLCGVDIRYVALSVSRNWGPALRLYPPISACGHSPKPVATILPNTT
jgi:hypothetical protein